MDKLLLATRNPGKVKEYIRLLKGIPFELTTLEKEGIRANIPEGGATLEENAVAKARAYVSLSDLLTLADDSGLEVEALGGEPGPISARYAGEGASDEERIRYLLSKLQSVPWEKRAARFRCVIAIANPAGELVLCQGKCEGFIALWPKGENGFGYDPIFYLPHYRKTMAELPLAAKNRISHRGQAAGEVKKALKEWARENPRTA